RQRRPPHPARRRRGPRIHAHVAAQRDGGPTHGAWHRTRPFWTYSKRASLAFAGSASKRAWRSPSATTGCALSSPTEPRKLVQVDPAGSLQSPARGGFHIPYLMLAIR